METYSIHKGAQIAPRKARMTLDLIRGKNVSQAEAILLTTNTKASRLIIKVLNSAVANAVNNFGAKKEDLVIKELERTFRPEFINRIDEVIIFKPLTKEIIYQVLDKI